MRIEIFSSQKGSCDGIRVREYVVGEVFDVPSPDMSEALAAVFLREEWAKEVPADPGPDDDKQLKPDLEIKDMHVPELKVLAEKAGIEGFSKMLKPDLVTALEKAELAKGQKQKQDALNAVIESIAALPEAITLEVKPMVVEASVKLNAAKLNGVTDEEITNLGLLVAAEQAIVELEKSSTPPA